MSAFSEDYTRQEIFQTRAGLPLADENLPLTVLEWSKGHAHGTHFRAQRVSDLTAHSDDWSLRVMYERNTPSHKDTVLALRLPEHIF
jgi:hypothetical protein